MIFEDIVEMGVFLYKNIDCFITHKLHLFMSLGHYLLFAHRQNLRAFFLT